jgi:hypothetical protein
VYERTAKTNILVFGSNWAFDQFTDANQKTIDVNQQAFDKTVAQGFKDMDGFGISTPVVVVRSRYSHY